ncbi:uncharacterized protein DFL_006334 [Arthrobotrys flagrans]|uniref:Uncharacterized protein n=1 Tax=Arthrobotrys flagrans TaxID=97331 RepID=A0A437A0T6_ARTFL|nr:hypothetical protein DFL_006334 [Arthrobotrys flagrans]
MIPTGGRKSGNWYQFHYIYIVTNHQNNLHDPKKALGPYGRATRPEAIVPNPAVNNFKGIYGGHAGLKLLVPKSYTVIRGEKYLVGAESDSTRNDMFYGTFGLRSRRVRVLDSIGIRSWTFVSLIPHHPVLPPSNQR